MGRDGSDKVGFLESVHHMIDGPKLPFHTDYMIIPEMNAIDWLVVSFRDGKKYIESGPHSYTEVAEVCARMNKEFREAGSTRP
jgi:hypothetical protein